MLVDGPRDHCGAGRRAVRTCLYVFSHLPSIQTLPSAWSRASSCGPTCWSLIPHHGCHPHAASGLQSPRARPWVDIQAAVLSLNARGHRLKAEGRDFIIVDTSGQLSFAYLMNSHGVLKRCCFGLQFQGGGARPHHRRHLRAAQAERRAVRGDARGRSRLPSFECHN